MLTPRYAEFWTRYLCFLNRCAILPDLPAIRKYALSRAAHIFCTGRPDMILSCALLHEIHSEADDAKALFSALHTTVAPRSLECVSRHANFQRRVGEGARAIELIQSLLAEFRTAGDEATVVWLAQLLCVMEVSVERGSSGLVKGEKGSFETGRVEVRGADQDEHEGTAAEAAAEALAQQGAMSKSVATPPQSSGSGGTRGGVSLAGGVGNPAPGAVAQTRVVAGGAAQAGTPGGNLLGSNGDAKEGETTVAMNSEGSSAASVEAPRDGSAEAELTQVLTSNPSNEGAWSAAITAIELKYFGAERAAKVLMICRQAVSATVPHASAPLACAASTAALSLACSSTLFGSDASNWHLSSSLCFQCPCPLLLTMCMSSMVPAQADLQAQQRAWQRYKPFKQICTYCNLQFGVCRWQHARHADASAAICHARGPHCIRARRDGPLWHARHDVGGHGAECRHARGGVAAGSAGAQAAGGGATVGRARAAGREAPDDALQRACGAARRRRHGRASAVLPAAAARV